MISKKTIILGFTFFAFFFSTFAQEDIIQLTQVSNKCVQCHGGKHYTVYNDYTSMNERKFMNPFFIIDSVDYLKGVHKTFSCDDCHSPEYEDYPHKAELKMEPQYTCLDCHGGDEMFAQFHFDEIALEVEKSVHVEKFGVGFKCEMCHNPHTYKLVARSDKFNIKEMVQRNNEMCLACHDDLDSYQQLSDNENPEIKKKHSWLPNQQQHFNNVRCIECHTPTDDTLMVSHNILSKDKAVRQCVECHSTTSILQDQLYKYKAKQTRTNKGFYNAVIMNESYVIGANRNKYLNNLSLMLFGLTLGGIFIHIIVRIIKRK